MIRIFARYGLGLGESDGFHSSFKRPAVYAIALSFFFFLQDYFIGHFVTLKIDGSSVSTSSNLMLMYVRDHPNPVFPLDIFKDETKQKKRYITVGCKTRYYVAIQFNLVFLYRMQTVHWVAADLRPQACSAQDVPNSRWRCPFLSHRGARVPKGPISQ